MNSSYSKNFILPKTLWGQIQNHLQANLPEEACGLVGGIKLPGIPVWQAHTIYPVENILHSPYRYYMDGHTQLKAFELIDRAELEMIAIFHSHPNGPATPSPIDINESYYPEAVQLIGYRVGYQWQCRAYLLTTSNFYEINLMLSDE